MRVPLTESVLGWATAMGEVLVMVVMVAAGSIKVDMSTWRINLRKNVNQPQDRPVYSVSYIIV